MTGWTGQAHLLADDIREPGFACAALNASAWRARVDPGATRSLVGAALALTSNDAGPALWAAAEPVPDDKTLLEHAAELEGAAAQMLKLATQMARNCRASLEAGYAQAAAAAAALAGGASPDGKPAAECALAEARARIADCEAALEIIGEAGTRLAHAANCLARVPGDLESTYETPYQHLADGGTLPFSGEFLGGIVTIGAA